MTDFDEFWSRYPKRVAKGAARKAWNKLQPDAELVRQILDAVDRQADQWDEWQFIPHPATWLRQERWDDEIGPARARGKTAGNVVAIRRAVRRRFGDAG